MPSKFIVKQAKKAGKRYHVPAKILMGLMEQESGFNPGAVSSAGAQGLTQFIPSTAKAYGVKYGTSKKAQKTQIRGAAHYLKDLGVSQDKRTALGRYYGSTSSPYASEVIAKSKKYKGIGKGVGSGSSTSKSKKASTSKKKSTKAQTVTAKTPGVSFKAERQTALLDFINTEDKTAADYIGLESTLQQYKDIPAQKKSVTVPGVKGGKAAKKAKEGQAAKKKGGGKGKASDIVDIGKIAERMGLSVGENPHFGGVSPVHVSGSYHYSGRAIDVSGDPKKMAKFANKMGKKYGPKLAELFWNGHHAENWDNGSKVGKGYVSDHTDHVHVAW